MSGSSRAEAAGGGSPRILTNMVFWQSATWRQHTQSLYPVEEQNPAPREWGWWREAWALFRKRQGYEVVLTMGARTSLAYGLLCAWSGQPSRQIMTEVFLDEPCPDRAWWRIKTRGYRTAAQRSMGIITNSSAEVITGAERLGLDPARLRFVPLCTTLPPADTPVPGEGFILAAGRTLRDYPTLLAALQHVQIPTVIICGARDLQDSAIPPHVSIQREVSTAQYLEYLHRCSLVVVPLRPTLRSTGQVVMLEAMALGKPVIATRSPGTVDYITSGQNGWLVEAGQPEPLARTMAQAMEQAPLRQQTGAQALARVKAQYSFEVHARAKLAVVREWAGQQRA